MASEDSIRGAGAVQERNRYIHHIHDAEDTASCHDPHMERECYGQTLRDGVR